MVNALTVDVEDYYHVTAFEKDIKREDWGNYSHRVGQNTRKLLNMFESFKIRATFFILGCVGQRDPDLVREIAARGHEIACHGYGHELVYRIGPERFREDVRKAKTLLEGVAGVPVRGYRAPSYSIIRESLWALEILLEEGFTYDSSIYPIYHDIYGIPDAYRFPHYIQTPAGSIKEFPLSTVVVPLPFGQFRIPVAGGGYLRIFPLKWVDWAVRRINEKERQPAIVYFHPWEIDPDQPKIRTSMKSRFRHYYNLGRMEGKIRYLLQRHRFGALEDILDSCILPEENLS